MCGNENMILRLSKASPCIRRDRVGRTGGGVCMYIKSDLLVNTKDGITNGAMEGAESLWLELLREETKGKLIVGVCYRSPTLMYEKVTDIFL